MERIVHCPLTSRGSKAPRNAALCTAVIWALLEAKGRCLWVPCVPHFMPHGPQPLLSSSPWLQGAAAAVLLFSLPPVLSLPLSTLIQKVFIWSFAPSAAQTLNVKDSRDPGLQQKCCLGYDATAIHLHYQFAINARCIAGDCRYWRFSFLTFGQRKEKEKKIPPKIKFPLTTSQFPRSYFILARLHVIDLHLWEYFFLCFEYIYFLHWFKKWNGSKTGQKRFAFSFPEYKHSTNWLLDFWFKVVCTRHLYFS